MKEQAIENANIEMSEPKQRRAKGTRTQAIFAERIARKQAALKDTIRAARRAEVERQLAKIRVAISALSLNDLVEDMPERHEHLDALGEIVGCIDESWFAK